MWGRVPVLPNRDPGAAGAAAGGFVVVIDKGGLPAIGRGTLLHLWWTLCRCYLWDLGGRGSGTRGAEERGLLV